MEKNIQNWSDLKFGMFITFGLYSILGEGEWVMFNKPIDKDEYSMLKERFTTEKFNASGWAKIAKEAGMKYMVFTARHHDGFSLFDSKASVGDFTSMNCAARRDFVAEFTKACREAGLAVGLYYSPMDWRFPGYFLPRMYMKSALQMKEQCHEQLRELLTNYGKIDILWFDGGDDYWLCHGHNLHNNLNTRPANFRENPQISNFWEADKLDKMARELQPGIVINNRSGQRQYGDFLTPERKIGEWNPNTPWETCDVLAGSWGWVPDAVMRSLRDCIHLIIKIVTGGGNLLLNVGPRSDGTIEERQVLRLKEIGDWLRKYGESVYDTKGGPLLNGSWGGTTWKENKLYIHVIDWQENEIIIPNLSSKIVEISTLTASDLFVEKQANIIRLNVPEEDKLALDTIIVIEYELNVDKVFEDFDANSFLQTRHLESDALIV